VLIVVSYDVPNNRRRTRLSHALEDWGVPVQLSVFECLVTGPDVEKLEARLLPLIDADEDSLRIYTLCETCRAKVRVHGTARLTADDPDVYVL
jgi:CRISPR-associated protein Cas2